MNDMAERMMHKTRAGFSLVETIVALAIIAIIMVVALVGFNTIARLGNSAQEWNQADQTVEDMIATNTGYVNSDPLNITLTPGGDEASVVIKGVLRTFTDPASGKEITVFVPD